MRRGCRRREGRRGVREEKEGRLPGAEDPAVLWVIYISYPSPARKVTTAE